jgi:hypothetical protein
VTAEPLREARALLESPPSTHPGLWERAATLLARQALEEALDGFWHARSPDLLHASMRAQLLCLGPLMNNDRDAARVAQLWGALSDACHFNALQPTPSLSEVQTWLDQTECLCALLTRKAGRTVAHT